MMIMIAVEDEGRGIPAELRERVFDKFFRATAEGAASLGRPKGWEWAGHRARHRRGARRAHLGGERGGRLGARVAFTMPVGDEEIDEGLKHDESIAANFSRR